MTILAEKVCTKCQVSKPETEFYLKAKKPGDPKKRVAECKVCQNQRQKIWLEALDPADRASMRRSITLKHFYKITIEQYDQMLERQGGHCAVCPSTTSRSSQHEWFVVDHDHSCCPTQKTCGKCIRGLICYPCNSALGLMGDSPDMLEAAARYLRTAALVES